MATTRTDERFLQALYRGGELLAAGKIIEAKEHLEVAYELDPKNEKSQNLLGLTYFKLGVFDRAAEIYEALVRENPADPTLRVNLGLVYLKTNALQRAVREFETATDLAPEHKKAQNYLGLALAQQGEYGRAREHFILAGSDVMAEKMARAIAGETFAKPPPVQPAKQRGFAEIEGSDVVAEGERATATPPPVEEGWEGQEHVHEEASWESSAEETQVEYSGEDGSGGAWEQGAEEVQVEISDEAHAGVWTDPAEVPAADAADGNWTSASPEEAQAPTEGSWEAPATESWAASSESEENWGDQVEPAADGAIVAAPEPGSLLPVVTHAPEAEQTPEEELAALADGVTDSESGTVLELRPEDAVEASGGSVEEAFAEFEQTAPPAENEESFETVGAELEAASSEPSPHGDELGSAVTEAAEPESASEAESETTSEATYEPASEPTDEAASERSSESETAFEDDSADVTFEEIAEVEAAATPEPTATIFQQWVARADVFANEHAASFTTDATGATLRVIGGLSTRVHGLAAVKGQVEFAPLLRRTRGRSNDRGFGSGLRQMMRASGEGALRIGRASGHFEVATLADESVFLVEERVFAFEDGLVYDNGRIAVDVAPDIDLVNLRGEGAVLLQLGGPLQSAKLSSEVPVLLPIERLVGWVGDVNPRVVTLPGSVVGAPRLGVELSGEGFAMFSGDEE